MQSPSSNSRKALVTGGNRGLGRAIAERLRHDGWDVYITSRQAQAPESWKDRHFTVDFGDETQFSSFLKMAGDLGADALINNAGINAISDVDQITLADFDLIQSINVRAPFRLCQAVIPHMKASQWGRILNVGSIFGAITRAQRTSYSTSKAAIAGMTRTMAVDLGPFGILVNCLAPGFCKTELTDTMLSSEEQERLSQMVPLKRFARPEEIGKFAAWIVSEENSFVTGQTLTIDGGFTIV